LCVNRDRASAVVNLLPGFINPLPQTLCVQAPALDELARIGTLFSPEVFSLQEAPSGSL
jgi:hypothetical protein